MPTHSQKTTKQEATKALQSRISAKLSEVQIRYLTTHMDIAARMNDKFLTQQIEEQRGFFYSDEGWDFATNNPHAGRLSRDPKEVKRAEAKLEEWAAIRRQSDAESAKKETELAAKKARGRHRFGL